MPDSPSPVAPPKTVVRRRPRRWFLTILSALFLIVLLTALTAYFLGYDLGKAWLESPAGQKVASAGLGKAIKVDGEFSPIHLNGWNIQIDSFNSVGWPGEAIGGLNATNLRAQFEPAAIWDGAYKIKGIQMDTAEIVLVPPDDALKRKMPPKKPRPWYAAFLPSRFESGPMVSANTKLTFTFQKETAHLDNAHVQADLIVKDFKYTANSGVLHFSYLPDMEVKNLEMLVTRPLITIYDIELVGLNGDPARFSLKGEMGMREDKHIDATVGLVEVPIEQIMPAELAHLVHGRATGNVVWKTDITGKKIFSEGEVSLSGAGIDNLSVFKQLAMLHGNPDLQAFEFDHLSVKYHLENDVFEATLTAHSPGKFSLAGKIRYELKTKFADLELAFNDLPLKTWLPPEFKPRIDGTAHATMKWHGHLNTIKESTGAVTIDLDGTRINNPVLLRKAVEAKGLRAPDEIFFKTLQIAVNYEEESFTLKEAKMEIPGILDAIMTGKLTSPDNTLDAELTWSGLSTENWLPQLVSDQFSGDIEGHAKLHVKKWKLAEGTYSGDIALKKGELRYTSIQYLIARFMNDRKLLKIPLTRASFDWSWSNNALAVRKLDLRGADDIGVQGKISINSDKQLSGVLLVGTKKPYLDALCGLADGSFSEKRDGLLWAKVNLTGTLKKPEQDLSKQLMDEAGRNPGAVIGLSGKLVSWYLGNLVGADEEWKAESAKARVNVPK